MGSRKEAGDTDLAKLISTSYVHMYNDITTGHFSFKNYL